MFTQNINNKTSFKYKHTSQKKKMQIHKKIFLTLAASLLFTVNYGNSCLVSAAILQDAQDIQKSWDEHYRELQDKLESNMTETGVQELYNHTLSRIKDFINVKRLTRILDNIPENELPDILTKFIGKTTKFIDEREAIERNEDKTINKITALLEATNQFIYSITPEEQVLIWLRGSISDTDIMKVLHSLNAKYQEKSDPKTQAEIKQIQKIIDQQNRLTVIKEQEKLRIAQAAIEAQTYAVQNIAVILSTRMNANREDENKPVAAGSETVSAYITPKSWDIWAGGHMGNIKQDSANATSANSKIYVYGGTIGIDKIFANTSVFGLALSYGKSNTEYTSKTSTGNAVNEKWASNYYQADIYAHHNFTDSLFLQLIGGISTYGDGTTIGNMFDFSSQKFILGYHSNATIGYSIFGGEDSNFVITPQLSTAYYHLNIPDSIIGKLDSSTFTTLERVDGVAGLNIKILNLNSDSNSNVKIIPEVTAAMKFRFHDKVNGINADNIKLPVVKSASSNDLSANALAAPEQLFTLGGALTVTNNNFSVSLHGSFDFAKQYFAAVGGISVKLSF